MPAYPHWVPPLLFACSLALWKIARERARLRTAWVFLSLWAGIWITTFLPSNWLPSGSVVAEVSLALVELAALLVSVVVVFDLLLRKAHVPKFVTEVALVAGYVAIVFHLLFNLGVNVTGIFATSAVATAVVGLALQDMLSNIAGGIALQVEGGIRPGDFITCGEFSGWVHHVRLRHTSIRTANNDTVILPNYLLTRSSVNICELSHRRFVPFTMPYSVNQQEVIDTVELALRSSPIPGMASEPAPTCVIRELEPGHIQYAAVVWLTQPGRETEPVSAVSVRVCFALRRVGIPASEAIHALQMRGAEATNAAELTPVDALRLTPILRLLEEDDLQEVSEHLQNLCFAPGECIVRQGDVGDSMYFIVSGQAEIRFRSPDGIERQVAQMGAGDFFGEASLLTGETRSATAVAQSRVDCYR